MFIHRLAGIPELFLLLYLASAARQELGSSIPVLHRAWGVLSRTHSTPSAPQQWGRVLLVLPHGPKMICGFREMSQREALLVLTAGGVFPEGVFGEKKTFLAGKTGPAWNDRPCLDRMLSMPLAVAPVAL